MALQIHWQEGLFLQPHHLQRMQKATRDQIAAERQLGWAYPFGVIESRVSRDHSRLRIRFERLRVIMPSGLEINYPENAELPSLDIKQAFAKGAGSFSVFLGVPLWQTRAPMPSPPVSRPIHASSCSIASGKLNAPTKTPAKIPSPSTFERSMRA